MKDEPGKAISSNCDLERLFTSTITKRGINLGTNRQTIPRTSGKFNYRNRLDAKLRIIIREMYYKVSFSTRVRGTAARRMCTSKGIFQDRFEKGWQIGYVISPLYAWCTETAVTRLEGTKKPLWSESFGVDRIEFVEKWVYLCEARKMQNVRDTNLREVMNNNEGMTDDYFPVFNANGNRVLDETAIYYSLANCRLWLFKNQLLNIFLGYNCPSRRDEAAN